MVSGRIISRRSQFRPGMLRSRRRCAAAPAGGQALSYVVLACPVMQPDISRNRSASFGSGTVRAPRLSCAASLSVPPHVSAHAKSRRSSAHSLRSTASSHECSSCPKRTRSAHLRSPGLQYPRSCIAAIDTPAQVFRRVMFRPLDASSSILMIGAGSFCVGMKATSPIGVQHRAVGTKSSCPTGPCCCACAGAICGQKDGACLLSPIPCDPHARPRCFGCPTCRVARYAPAAA